MKIAIPTNDRKTIAKRTGRAIEFAIYSIENKEIQSVEYTKNTHSHNDQDDEQGKDHNHEHGEHNHDDLLTLFEKVDILFVRAIGKHMRKTLQKGNVNYQLVKIDAISKILENYLKSLI